MRRARPPSCGSAARVLLSVALASGCVGANGPRGPGPADPGGTGGRGGETPAPTGGAGGRTSGGGSDSARDVDAASVDTAAPAPDAASTERPREGGAPDTAGS